MAGCACTFTLVRRLRLGRCLEALRRPFLSLLLDTTITDSSATTVRHDRYLYRLRMGILPTSDEAEGQFFRTLPFLSH